MSVYAAVSFFVAVFIFSVTPGPGVFAILARALVSGAKSCFWLSFGMTVSDILYLIAACFGLATIATHWSEVFWVIRIAGAGYLFYLGWKLWQAPVSVSANEIQFQYSAFKSFAQGFLISASNPKVILFYIAFLPTFMDLTILTAGDILLVSVLTLISLMTGLSTVAWFAAAARKFFETERGARALNKSAGSIMMTAGAYLLLHR